MTKASKTAKNDPALPRRARSTSKPQGVPTSKTEDSGSMSAPTADDTQPAPAASPPAPKQPSKQDRLAAMLVRDEGASLDAMVEATGWLKHTVRAALTGLKKKGCALSSDKVDGVRTYRAVAPE